MTQKTANYASPTRRLFARLSRLLITTIIAVMSVSIGYAENTNTVLNSDSTDIDLTENIDYLEDKQASIVLIQLLGDNAQYKFTASNQQRLNFGYTQSAYWLRWKQVYQTTTAMDWFLTISDPLLDHADLYVVKADGSVVIKQAGQAIAQTDREIQNRLPTFKITGAPGTADTIYLRVASDDPLQLSLTLHSNLALSNETFFDTLLIGAYYGLMLAMLAYNAFIFLALKEKAYLFYCAYLMALIPAQMSFDGLSYLLFWPDSPWWANRSSVLLSGAVALTGTQFARVFLNTRTYSPPLDKLLILLLVLSALVIPCSLTYPYPIAATAGVGITVIFPTLMLATAIIGYLRNVPNAGFFLVAWLTFMAGLLVRALTTTGQIDANPFTIHAAQFGAALETVLFSFALANRINQVQREKRDAQVVAAKALTQSNIDLKASNKIKDRFLGTISHELRTPMNGIQGMLDLIRSTPLSTKQQEYVKYANMSTHEMLNHIDVLLSFSEAQSRRLSIKHVPFQLTPMLEELADTYERSCAQKYLEFNFIKGEGLPNAVYGDPIQLKVILSNLLDNATKFTDSGYVEFCINTVSTTKGSTGNIPLNFSIRDTGPGLAPIIEKNLFKPFSQGDSSSSRRHGGLGIGLALSAELTTLIGGTIDYSRNLTKGCTFTLSIDLMQAEETLFYQPRGTNTVPSKTIDNSNTRILIVEDNKVNQTLLKAILVQKGYATLTASNGEEALRYLAERTIDLVLMDCQMPVMDGFETTAIIREQKETYGNPPIIAVTSKAQSMDKDRCLNVGMNEYLTKPVNRYTLYKTINDCLSNKNLLESDTEEQVKTTG
ncbi:MAG: hypothetical protein COA99_04475 [Moraxellaceae bacterium]|nr:MAG: hypothetical protein COA99_04475 [Moraxellaceae bacterium]